MNHDWIHSHCMDVELDSTTTRFDEVAAGKLTLLHSERLFDYDNPGTVNFDDRVDRLWQVRFHTHEWLLELVSDAGTLTEPQSELLLDTLRGWCREFSSESSPFSGLAWNSYVVATRIRSWCLAYQFLPEEIQADVDLEFAAQITRHAELLSHNIEWDLRANHLLRDAVGLAFASRFVDHDMASSWHRLAASIARSQLQEQVLSDGGHFERSPMYHAEALVDFEDCAALLEDDESLVEELRSTSDSMKEVLRWCCHPDGKICLFNDAAFNGMPSAQWLLRDSSQQEDQDSLRGERLFRDFGLLAIHQPVWSIFFDVGRVGIDYQPGHAHADTLSVEASYCGARIFVDPGTFAYDRDSRRIYDRSTQSHNTVTVDDTDSTEVWDIFRVGRRAFPNIREYISNDHCVMCEASHDGYIQLPGRVRHIRRVEFARKSDWSIHDRIEGTGTHELAGGLLVAPEWNVTQSNNHEWTLVRNGAEVVVRVEGDDTTCTTEDAEYHPEYGMTHTTRRLCWRRSGSLPCEIRIRITAAIAN